MMMMMVITLMRDYVVGDNEGEDEQYGGDI